MNRSNILISVLQQLDVHSCILISAARSDLIRLEAMNLFAVQ
jgi:hypothetical protein